MDRFLNICESFVHQVGRIAESFESIAHSLALIAADLKPKPAPITDGSNIVGLRVTFGKAVAKQ